MRFEFSLARRYLRSPGKGLAKITSRLAVAGIALGVAALIFALALARGFREEVQEKLLSNTAHINISRADGEAIAGWSEIKARISKIAGVRSAAAASYESALLITARGNFYTVLRGREEIQPARKDGCAFARVGAELMARSGLTPGETADAVFGISSTEAGAEPKKICLTGENSFTTGIFEYDSSWIDVALGELGEPTIIEVAVDDIYRAKQAAESIRNQLGGEYKVIDWQEANKPFFAAMSFERQVVLVIISLVILLSALNITFTLMLGVTQRRPDIAILRAAGARSGQIVKAFLLEGMLLGVMGVTAGAAAGLAASFIANRFNLISLPPEVYSLNKITLRPDAAEVSLVIAAALVLCFVATMLPAFNAARIKPWENLRR